MGIVWRAVDERLARSVAVKQILTQPGLSDAERLMVRQRAMREAKNAARFQHPNAIMVFDIAEHDGDPCLVMEYLPSRSLSELIGERGVLPVPEVADIGEQVASALLAAHRAGIVHRDIKPGNILIDETGTCKITDFGISRASGDHTLTETGLIGGTPAYLAPELARGDDPTPSSDVFSLGATLYHAIEGIPPYGDSSNQLALLYKAANGEVNPPARAGGATALLMSLLRADPDERPSMFEARERLAALAVLDAGDAPTGGVVAPPPPPPSSPPPWQREHRDQQPAPPQRPATSQFGAPRTTASPGVGPGNRRKPLVLGAIAAAVLVLAAVTVIVLNMGGDDGGQNAQNQNAAPPSSSPVTTSAAPRLGQTEHTGDELSNFSAAAQPIDSFYSNPAGSWDLLTPAAQAAFGDRSAFSSYWSENGVNGYRSIRAYKGAPNEDGSVDMQVQVEFEGHGSETVTLRVVNSGGGLKIDGDPRPSGNRSG